ncbi:hypothetical protein BU17DRAFT_44256 [Hysterangium stoloniferum]|nr:hypothetical protein BU17DRAFT_44256 [Hysterangium stoloniferum]
MGRWTQYDEDEYRLCEGMKRIGYDADTQRYTFQKGNELWIGEPGVETGGNLTKAGTVHLTDDDGDDGVGNTMPSSSHPGGYQPLTTETDIQRSKQNAYRMFLPFMVVVGVCLLLIWHFIGRDSLSPAPSCPDGPYTKKYDVQVGDSCWHIAESHRVTVDSLLNSTLNPGLECTLLKPGDVVCLPYSA